MIQSTQAANFGTKLDQLAEVAYQNWRGCVAAQHDAGIEFWGKVRASVVRLTKEFHKELEREGTGQ